MKPYYMLPTIDDGQHFPQFGDYSKAVISQEKEDSYSEGKTKITRLTDDLQTTLKAALIALNPATPNGEPCLRACASCDTSGAFDNEPSDIFATFTTSEDEAAVYITTYGIYKSGLQGLKGLSGWVSVSDYEQFKDEVTEQLETLGDGDELMHTDWQNVPDQLISECSIDFNAISQWEELAEEQQTIVEAITNHGFVSTFAEAIEKHDQAYLHGGDITSYAEEHYKETCDLSQVPASLLWHIDWSSVGESSTQDGNLLGLDGQILVWHGR